MAIRRGPLAAPDDATKVFAINTTGTNDSPNNNFTAGLVPDMNINTQTSGNDNYVLSRLLGNGFLSANSNAVFSTNATASYFDGPTGTIDLNTAFYGTASNVISWSWKRAPSYFDVVAYTGTGSARTVSHNLGAVPEMIWVKCRSASSTPWIVYHKDLDASNPSHKYLYLNSDGAVDSFDDYWNQTEPTASVFSTKDDYQNHNNNASHSYIAYLFASVAGISKLGSYTGNATDNHVIDCGFSSGARFVLIKKTSDPGEWFVVDTVRGIVAGADPFLELNQTRSQITGDDIVDPNSSGFALSSRADCNENGQTYIFYAIA
jgi:hypothetical protein